MMRPYSNYKPYGPARPVPRLLFMPFPGHRSMDKIIEEEKRLGRNQCEQDNADQPEPA